MSVHTLIGAAVRAAEDTEFDPTQVTPGVEGFAATAVFAAAVIVLGFLLVRRLRRSQYRSEVREQIAAELSEGEGGAGNDGSADPDSRS